MGCRDQGTGYQCPAPYRAMKVGPGEDLQLLPGIAGLPTCSLNIHRGVSPPNLCELLPLGTVTLPPPPPPRPFPPAPPPNLGSDPDGNSPRLPKRSEVRLGGRRRRRRGQSGGRDCDHQTTIPFPSPLLWSTRFPFLWTTLALLGQAAPGTRALNWGPFSQPGIFLDFLSFPGRGDWCKPLN